MNNLQSKVAVVTGGTRGIGRAISLELAERGATVYALFARNRKGAEALEAEAALKSLLIKTVRGDLSHEESYRQSVTVLHDSCERVDVLVHAAATGVHRRAMELSPRHLRWTFETNVFAVHKLTTDLISRMRKGARIIGITSPGGTRVIPQYAAVASTKGAMEALFRHYALELAPEGIVVNLVCPGLVMTEAAASLPELQKMLEEVLEYTPSGRLTTPDDVARVVGFLTTDAGAQIVGQNIVVDGGKGLLA